MIGPTKRTVEPLDIKAPPDANVITDVKHIIYYRIIDSERLHHANDPLNELQQNIAPQSGSLSALLIWT